MGAAAEAAVRELLALFFAPDIAANLDQVAACFTEDATYQPQVPLAPVAHGRVAIVAELAQQARRYNECLCRIDNIASTERVVFTERMDTVRMLGDGRRVVARVNAVFELDSETRVTAWREYWDVLAVARQVGVAAEAMPIAASATGHDR